MKRERKTRCAACGYTQTAKGCRKSYNVETGKWVRVYKCWECGCEVLEGDVCCESYKRQTCLRAGLAKYLDRWKAQ